MGHLEDRYKVLRVPNATTLTVLEEGVWLNNRTFERMFLWAMDPDPDYTGDSVILPLCYSCHDNTVANGSYIPDAAHNHPQGVADYRGAPITEYENYESSCKKCMEPDCGKCHDAHDDTWVFLDSERFTPFDYDEDGDDEEFMNASVCSWCHEGSRHGIDSYDGDGNPIPHTTHPEAVSQPEGAFDFLPPAGANLRWWGDVGDLLGTRLWDDTTVYLPADGGDDTQQYVVEEGEGPGDIRCMSCHTTHAGEDDDLQTMGYDVDAADPTSNSAICINCHE